MSKIENFTKILTSPKVENIRCHLVHSRPVLLTGLRIKKIQKHLKLPTLKPDFSFFEH